MKSRKNKMATARWKRRNPKSILIKAYNMDKKEVKTKKEKK